MTRPTPDVAAIDRVLHAYRESAALMAAVRLGLFAALVPDRGVPVTELAAHAGISEEAADVLIDVLTSVGLTTRAADGVRPTPLAAAHLTAGAPYPLVNWVTSEHEKYVGFAGLAEALTAPAGPPDAVTLERRRRGTPPEHLEGLAEVARARAPETVRVLRALGVPEAGLVLDAIGLLLELPGWRGVLADRERPCAVATANAKRYDVASRLRTVEADLTCDDIATLVGEPVDAAFLFMVLGGKPAEEAAAVLGRVHAALRPGGWLLVRGNWTDRARGASSALKHMLRPGGRRTMTQERTLALLGDAGFVDVAEVDLPGVEPHAVVAARRPG